MTTTETPTSELTDLAALKHATYLIRLRAEAATKSPWKAAPVWSPDATATSAVYSHAHPTGTVQSEVVAAGRVRPGYGGIRRASNAVHIASFADPAVALAVADLLDSVIEDAVEQVGIDGQGDQPLVLAIVRAYLAGEPR